ncbi:MAG: LacI family DNA-binding transcriptional regulator [Chitinivibrionales bacterium]|nr:LacI family DNA-binding transcriptional regulator [Chitinivibrionales bacterium]
MSGGLEDIAARLGVAVSTVSRALAGKPGVSEQRRARIVQLAAELGYIPDPLASTLRSGRGSGLAVIVTSRPTGISAMRNYAIFSHGSELFGHTRVLVVNENETLDHVVRQALQQKCRAIVVSTLGGVLADETIAALEKRRVPLAIIDAECNAGSHFRIDRSAGTCQCARLLVLNGCRHIVVFSTASPQNPDPRLDGIQRGFAGLGQALPTENVVPIQAGHEGGYRAMKELLRERAVDAAFCYSDETAQGALRALAEARVAVPGQVQIVGFDNLPSSAYGSIPLTTVAQPVDEIARAAVTLCAEQAEHSVTDPVMQTFPTRLIVRESAPVLRHEIRARIFDQSDTQSQTEHLGSPKEART